MKLSKPWPSATAAPRAFGRDASSGHTQAELANLEIVRSYLAAIEADTSDNRAASAKGASEIASSLSKAF